MTQHLHHPLENVFFLVKIPDAFLVTRIIIIITRITIRPWEEWAGSGSRRWGRYPCGPGTWWCAALRSTTAITSPCCRCLAPLSPKVVEMVPRFGLSCRGTSTNPPTRLDGPHCISLFAQVCALQPTEQNKTNREPSHRHVPVAEVTVARGQGNTPEDTLTHACSCTRARKCTPARSQSSVRAFTDLLNICELHNRTP